MIRGVIFDLDGVLVSTDECHFQAWKELADSEGIPFDREINHRLRGVSRMQSLEILLERAARRYTDEEKQALAKRKNDRYLQSIEQLDGGDILPGAVRALKSLKERGLLTAVGSSSRNARRILQKLGLEHSFDAVADGNDITRSKPDPEVFLVAAGKLGLPPGRCLVVEDALTGVEAALRAGMPALAVGAAQEHPLATVKAESLDVIDLFSVVQALEAGEAYAVRTLPS